MSALKTPLTLEQLMSAFRKLEERNAELEAKLNTAAPVIEPACRFAELFLAHVRNDTDAEAKDRADLAAAELSVAVAEIGLRKAIEEGSPEAVAALAKVEEIRREMVALTNPVDIRPVNVDGDGSPVPT